MSFIGELTSIHLTLFLGSPFTDGSLDDQGRVVGTVSIKRVYNCDDRKYCMIPSTP